jgi:acyl carrier protein
MSLQASTLHDVREIIIQTLGIDDSRRQSLNAGTQLFGGIPELDSFAVISLAMALEQHFGFEIDDSEFTGDVFDTIGSLSEFVERSRVAA